MITMADARRILGTAGSGLSDDQLAARLGELAAIASDIEKAYKSSKKPEKKH